MVEETKEATRATDGLGALHLLCHAPGVPHPPVEFVRRHRPHFGRRPMVQAGKIAR
ncbi:hypothetical protein [Elstera cyanobacteriorum]|uniref:hypothetical protein n=1 Tax=Elstera cyanobacteriorum TaxID=2022747 RepID=UPI001482333B|nr:hypothetical protein [Elstera cyanobacteriorum]